LKDTDVADALSNILDKYVAVPADKASNNIVVICKKHYIDRLKIILGLDISQDNPTYTVTPISR
jgi:hypothetical protein